MQWIRASLLWGAFVVLSAIPALAQGTISFSIGDSRPRPILNAPYSIVEETEHTQTLTDGTHMVTRNKTRLYRDSYGRTRSESFYIRAGVAEEPKTIVINDPIAGTSYTLFVRQRVARTIAPPVGLPNNPNVVYKSASTAEGARPKSTSEDLGTQSIEGVLVEGVRSTTVYPEGLMGNDKAIQTVSERWVSKELGLTLLEKDSDPRFGETVTRVTSLDRAEPDPALFQIPPDYIVQEPNTK
jgi:hypothetical protein